MVTPKRRQRLGPGIAAPDAAPSQVGLPPDIEYEAQRGAYVPRPESPTLVENIIKGVSSGARKLGGAVQQAYGYDPGIPRGLMGLPAEARQRIFGPRTIQQEQAPPEQRRIEIRAGYEEERGRAAAAAPYGLVPEPLSSSMRQFDKRLSEKTAYVFEQLDAPFAIGAEVLTAIGAQWVPEFLYTSENFQQLSQETRDDLRKLIGLTFTQYGDRSFYRGGGSKQARDELVAGILARQSERPIVEQLAVQLPLGLLSGGVGLGRKAKRLKEAVESAAEEGPEILEKSWVLKEFHKKAIKLRPESETAVQKGRQRRAAELIEYRKGVDAELEGVPIDDPRWIQAQERAENLKTSMTGALKPEFEELKRQISPKQRERWNTEMFRQQLKYPGFFGVDDADNAKAALNNLIDRGIVPARWETELLEKFFGTGLRQLSKKEQLVANMLNVTREAFDLPRAVTGSVDFSAMFRQAWHLSTRKEFYGAALKGMRAFVDEDYAARIVKGFHKDPALGRLKSKGLYISEYGSEKGWQHSEEIWRANLARKIPFVKWSARAHTTFLNSLRLNMAKNFENKMMRDVGARNMDEFTKLQTRAANSKNPTGIFAELNRYDENMEHFTKFINYATGRGSTNDFVAKWLKGEGILDVLSFPFWAPRLALSRIQAPAMIFTKHSRARKEIFRDLIGSTSMALGALGLLNLRHDAEVSLDHGSADFGKGRVGNQRFDFWGGNVQIARLTARLLDPAVLKDGADLGAETKKRTDIIGRFLRGKLHPSVSTIPDLWWPILKDELGETFVGEKIEPTAEGITTYLSKHFMPIFAQEYADIAQEARTLEELVTGTGAALFGHGVGAYAPSNRDVERARVNTMLIPETFYELMEGKRFELSPIEVPQWLRDLIDNPEELKKKFQDKFGNPDTSLLPDDIAARIDRDGYVQGEIGEYNEKKRSGDSEWGKYQDQLKGIDDETSNRISNSFEVNQHSETLRNHISSALQDRAARRGQERTRANDDGLFDRPEVDKTDSEVVFNTALQDYYDRMYPPITQAEKEEAAQTGARPYLALLDSAMNYDFERRDRILADLEEDYGEDIVQRILVHGRRNDHPVVTELREDREFLREYFEYPDKLAADQAEKFPKILEWLPEAWREYKKIGDDKAFKENYINKTLVEKAERDGVRLDLYRAHFKKFLSIYSRIRSARFRVPSKKDTAEEIAHKEEVTRVLLKWGYITHDQVPNEFKDLKLEYRQKQRERMRQKQQGELQSVPDVPGVEREIVGAP